MSTENLLLEIINELSGERAKRLTGVLSQYHRIQASKEFLAAVEVINEELKKIGDKDSEIHEYIADGTKRYYEWNAPLSWDIKDGELILLEPLQKNMCQYSEVPESICTHSKSIDIKTEVIHIGEGKLDDIKEKNLEGKIVLTSGRPREIFERLAEFKVAGIIVYPSEQRAQGYLQMIQYVGLWPNAENLTKSTFGFSISRKQALELLSFMKDGKKVIVHGKIDADIYEGKMHVLSTKIQGTKKPFEEIILIAHICHPAPSANDNASGSALLFEVYRTIKMLIEKNKILPPQRTIRFLWVPEFHGTIPWIMERIKEETFKPMFCINLDMCGEHPALVGYPFTFSQSSISTPSYLNDLVSMIINNVKDNNQAIEQGGWQFAWNYRINPFSGGSDHILFNDDPVKIPSIMFGHPDTFHHTNLDTIEKVDPTTMKRVGVTTTMATITAAYENQYSTQILNDYILGYHKRKGKLIQMIKEEKDIQEKLEAENKVIKSMLIHNTIKCFIQFENKILDSITNNFQGLDKNTLKMLKNDILSIKETLESILPLIEKQELSEKTKDELDKIPRRKMRGPLNTRDIFKLMSEDKKFEENLQFSEEKLESVKDFVKASMQGYGGNILELFNLINNEKSIYDIISYMSLVNWKIPNWKNILDFLDFAQEIDLIYF
ncbi:MAG: DUF4910 domain-containing protein [Candidatus Thorarchaeota archaeon]